MTEVSQGHRLTDTGQSDSGKFEVARQLTATFIERSTGAIRMKSFHEFNVGVDSNNADLVIKLAI